MELLTLKHPGHWPRWFQRSLLIGLMLFLSAALIFQNKTQQTTILHATQRLTNTNILLAQAQKTQSSSKHDTEPLQILHQAMTRNHLILSVIHTNITKKQLHIDIEAVGTYPLLQGTLRDLATQAPGLTIVHLQLEKTGHGSLRIHASFIYNVSELQ